MPVWRPLRYGRRCRSADTREARIAQAHHLLRAPAAPRVVMETTFDRDEYLYVAMQAGASGFLLKDMRRRTHYVGSSRPVESGIPFSGPTAGAEEEADDIRVDAEDAARALQEAEEAKQQLAMDQVAATRELVALSTGQSANTVAVLEELRGMHGELKSGGRWSRRAAIGAWASVGVGLLAALIAGFALWANLASGSATGDNGPTSPPAIESSPSP